VDEARDEAGTPLLDGAQLKLADCRHLAVELDQLRS
jgi:hypothetical protein